MGKIETGEVLINALQAFQQFIGIACWKQCLCFEPLQFGVEISRFQFIGHTQYSVAIPAQSPNANCLKSLGKARIEVALGVQTADDRSKPACRGAIDGREHKCCCCEPLFCGNARCARWIVQKEAKSHSATGFARCCPVVIPPPEVRAFPLGQAGVSPFREGRLLVLNVHGP